MENNVHSLAAIISKGHCNSQTVTGSGLVRVSVTYSCIHVAKFQARQFVDQCWQTQL